MAKTSNLHIRIDPAIQQRAERVLKRLGLSIPDAVTVFLNQISLEGGIPFKIGLPASAGFWSFRPRYCYGVNLDETSDTGKDWFGQFRQKLTPDFGKQVDRWLEGAQAASRKKAGNQWSEEEFWLGVFRDDETYGDFESFEQLFKNARLCLIHVYSNYHAPPGTVPPFVVGWYLNRFDEDLVRSRGEKPRIFRALWGKLSGVFSTLDEDMPDHWGVDWSAEGSITGFYNRDAPVLPTPYEH